MSDSREESPDWLRSFQPPSQSAIPLSSGSESPLDRSPLSDDEDGINLSKLFKRKETKDIEINADDDSGKGTLGSKLAKGKSPKKNEKVKKMPGRKRTRKNEDEDKKEGKRAKGRDSSIRNRSANHEKPHERNLSILSLSSDSESCQDIKLITMDDVTKMELSTNEEEPVTEHNKEINAVLNHDIESPRISASKGKSSTKMLETGDENTSIKQGTSSSIKGENGSNDNFLKEDISRKLHGPQVSTSTVPLMLPEKVQRSKALVECDGDSIDLSGDVGSVGRIVISDDPSKNREMLLDLKGTIYKTTIVPSRTFCVVSFGQSEAKIEAIMNDYIQLKPQSNVYEAETMVEGTLDGFSFDSEDEADKATAQADQNEAADELPNAETKKKPGKAAGAGKKKGKTAVGQPPKKVKKKPHVAKKGKSKK